MTLKEAYEAGMSRLKEAGIAEYELDAWYLLEHVAHVSRAMYYLDNDKVLKEEECQWYEAAVEKRAERIPLQHITGEQEFMGLTFEVNEYVLVPRQDTECLVEEAERILKPGMRILDMCTGSGCILLSLLKRLSHLNIEGTGVDISEDAMEVAKRNGERHQVRAEWILSDLFENMEGEYDVIVSNPPYIRTKVIEELEQEVRCHDPYIALDGKEDGLYFYRKIIEGCKKYLKPNGKILFEIGHDQGEDVSRLLEEAGFMTVTVKKDLAGLDRVVIAM